MLDFTETDLRDLEHQLRRRLSAQVHFDAYSRVLYSTDASNYQIQPLGVVIPQVEDDLDAALEIAAAARVPVLARGAGTSLGGQTVGRALIIDCSRHLDQIHWIDPERQMAELGPGVVYADLNRSAATHGLWFGPDPASGDRASFGGMIGNNSTGAHSIRYGMTADHVLEADVILADASRAHFQALTESQATHKVQSGGLEGQIYAACLEIRQRYASAVRRDWPGTWRRASGYGLNYLTGFTPSVPSRWALDQPYIPSNHINLAQLLCGSEGTLAILRRAQVRLLPKPPCTRLVVLSYASIAAACDAVPALLQAGPSAVELIPHTIFERARLIPAYARRLTFIDEIPEAVLVVEFASDDDRQVAQAARRLAGGGHILETDRAQADLWAVRKAGLGLLMSVAGDLKPATFIEDVAVPVERLGDYVRGMTRILKEHGTQGEWYAHASAGCLHLRPLINLKTELGVRQIRQIAEAACDLTIELRGTLSGEHGDGLSRTEFNSRLFGPELSRAFVELKQAFDPQWILNPGKVVTYPEAAVSAALDRDLRYGPGYQAHGPSTTFDFAVDGGLAGAVERCNGSGVCRKSDGVMCPSYQVTREEMHSTRGRANALRAAMAGLLPAGALSSQQMYQVLDLCLECKGCKAECPTAVDMARIKAEFLDHYHAQHGVPLRTHLFAEVAAISRAAHHLGPLINAASRTRLGHWMTNGVLGLGAERHLPAFAPRTFRQQAGARPQVALGHPVVLFVDTFTNFNEPAIGLAALAVLEASGCHVILVPKQQCCGRPMVSKGLLARARQMAAANVAVLGPYAERGLPIICLEPSCASMLSDELPALLPKDPRAAVLAGRIKLIEEYLTEADESGQPPLERLHLQRGRQPLVFHGHCHTKALSGSDAMRRMLEAAAQSVEEVDSGCCGMAGSFGYEAEHTATSLAIGEMKLFPAVRLQAAKGAQIVAAGTSCRTQIKDGTKISALHPIQILANLLRTDEPQKTDQFLSASL
jgi:FAD/FMN-containing dehydrogenase/Fe-S oxidoreductase